MSVDHVFSDLSPHYEPGFLAMNSIIKLLSVANTLLQRIGYDFLKSSKYIFTFDEFYQIVSGIMKPHEFILALSIVFPVVCSLCQPS